MIIANNLFMKIREGYNDRAPPAPNPIPYSTEHDPPPAPPAFTNTPKQNPKVKAAAAARARAKADGLSEAEQEAAAAEAVKNVSSGPGAEPPYCGCIDKETQKYYNKNTGLLSQLKKDISNLMDTVKKKTKVAVKNNETNIAKSTMDDYNMCCGAGPDEREDDGEGDVRRDSKGKRIYGGLCYMFNKYKCPIPPKKGEEDEEDENLPSSKPTAAQIKSGR